MSTETRFIATYRIQRGGYTPAHKSYQANDQSGSASRTHQKDSNSAVPRVSTPQCHRQRERTSVRLRLKLREAGVEMLEYSYPRNEVRSFGRKVRNWRSHGRRGAVGPAPGAAIDLVAWKTGHPARPSRNLDRRHKSQHRSVYGGDAPLRPKGRG